MRYPFGIHIWWRNIFRKQRHWRGWPYAFTVQPGLSIEIEVGASEDSVLGGYHTVPLSNIHLPIAAGTTSVLTYTNQGGSPSFWRIREQSGLINYLRINDDVIFDYR